MELLLMLMMMMSLLLRFPSLERTPAEAFQGRCRSDELEEMEAAETSDDAGVRGDPAS